jgi:hypothetical protein
MLRLIVIALGIGLIAWGMELALVAHVPWQAAGQLVIFGSLVLVGTLLEKRYRSQRAAAGSSGWETTGEKFMDPSTGELTEVRYNPQTGERSYESAKTTAFPKI